MSYAFGLDGARFQTSLDGTKKWNFDTIASNPERVSFVAVRTGVSWAYIDAWFAYYWAELKRIMRHRLAYHVIYFGESPIAQMDSYFRITEGSDWAHDRGVLDLEVQGENSVAKITSTTLSCMEIFKQRTGRFPILYSRKNWVDLFLKVSDLPEVDWWLANYLTSRLYPLYTPEKLPPPLLPNGISTWLAHQTTCRGKSIGSVTYYMDYNRWNGDQIVVDEYFGYGIVPQPTPLSDHERIIVLENDLDTLENVARDHGWAV